MPETGDNSSASSARPTSQTSVLTPQRAARQMVRALNAALESRDWRPVLNAFSNHRTHHIEVLVDHVPLIFPIIGFVRPEEAHVVRELCKRGADPNGAALRELPLHQAAFLNKASVVHALVDAGAVVDKRNGFGNVALALACATNASAAVRALLRRGASVSDNATENGLLAIHCIGQKETVTADARGVVRALLESVPDTDRKRLLEARSPNGTTPLMLACAHSSWRAVEALLHAGADPCAHDKNRVNALNAVAINGDVTKMRLLVNAGAHVDAADDLGKTALMLAADQGFTAAVKLLVRRGANVHLKSKSGATAAAAAFRNEHFETLRALVRAGAPCPGRNTWDMASDRLVGSRYVGDHELVCARKEERSALRQRRVKRGAGGANSTECGTGDPVEEARKALEIPWLAERGGSLSLPDMRLNISGLTLSGRHLGRTKGRKREKELGVHSRAT